VTAEVPPAQSGPAQPSPAQPSPAQPSPAQPSLVAPTPPERSRLAQQGLVAWVPAARSRPAQPDPARPSLVALAPAAQSRLAQPSPVGRSPPVRSGLAQPRSAQPSHCPSPCRWPRRKHPIPARKRHRGTSRAYPPGRAVAQVQGDRDPGPRSSALPRPPRSPGRRNRAGPSCHERRSGVLAPHPDECSLCAPGPVHACPSQVTPWGHEGTRPGGG
jgi:hypothetical protein